MSVPDIKQLIDGLQSSSLDELWMKPQIELFFGYEDDDGFSFNHSIQVHNLTFNIEGGPTSTLEFTEQNTLVEVPYVTSNLLNTEGLFAVIFNGSFLQSVTAHENLELNALAGFFAGNTVGIIDQTIAQGWTDGVTFAFTAKDVTSKTGLPGILMSIHADDYPGLSVMITASLSAQQLH